jgi:alpha-L-rhamnosidase
MSKIALCLLILVASAHAAPVHLRTTALVNPLGIDAPQPTFSWQSDAKTPNWMQSTYEILVATNAEKLRPGKTDAWDSGRVKSSESLDITYAGAPIQSRQRYVWKVLVWDNKGKQTTLASAWFETGLISANDWRGEWITRDDPSTERELKDIRWIWLERVS